jgi:hypothetical protein
MEHRGLAAVLSLTVMLGLLPISGGFTGAATMYASAFAYVPQGHIVWWQHLLQDRCLAFR